jgi:hypothetical protein
LTGQLALPWTLAPSEAERAATCIAQPWSYCCLVCNRTSMHAMDGHRCPPDVQPYPRDYWLQRMRWALRAALDREPSADEVATIVDSPIARTEMARLLGARWLPSHETTAAPKPCQAGAA